MIQHEHDSFLQSVETAIRDTGVEETIGSGEEQAFQLCMDTYLNILRNAMYSEEMQIGVNARNMGFDTGRVALADCMNEM